MPRYVGRWKRALASPALNASLHLDGQLYDEKNIRRRVYDALNVLMAIGVITKEKKTITWVGLPVGVVRGLLL